MVPEATVAECLQVAPESVLRKTLSSAPATIVSPFAQTLKMVLVAGTSATGVHWADAGCTMARPARAAKAVARRIEIMIILIRECSSRLITSDRTTRCGGASRGSGFSGEGRRERFRQGSSNLPARSVSPQLDVPVLRFENDVSARLAEQPVPRARDSAIRRAGALRQQAAILGTGRDLGIEIARYVEPDLAVHAAHVKVLMRQHPAEH